MGQAHQLVQMRLGITAILLGLIALLITGTGSVIAVSLAVSPESIESGQVQLTEPCPALVSGEPCWSCGMTRSFTAMSRGRFATAYAYNHGGPWLYALNLLALLSLSWLWAWVWRTEFLVLWQNLRRDAPAAR